MKGELTTAADLFPLLDAVERLKRDLNNQAQAGTELGRIIQFKDDYIRELVADLRALGGDESRAAQAAAEKEGKRVSLRNFD